MAEQLSKRTNTNVLNAYAKDRFGSADALIAQDRKLTERQRYEGYLADGYSPDEAFVMANA